MDMAYPCSKCNMNHYPGSIAYEKHKEYASTEIAVTPEAKHTPILVDICPKCENPLVAIGYYEYSHWTYNPETGAYDNITLYGGTAEVKCFHCFNDVSDLFPEGPANK